MNQATETSPASPSVAQTTTVFVDRPCLKCGYNLRGQTATWNRRALNWQVKCPECGGDQVVSIGTPERQGLQNPLVALVLALAGTWIAWQLFQWLSTSQSSMMEVPFILSAPATSAAARRAALIATGTGSSTVTAFDGEWTTLALHVIVRAIPILMSTALLGVGLALAPYGKHRARDLLVVVFALVACTYGVYLNITGAGDPLNPQVRTQLLQLVSMGGTTPGGLLLVYDWKWRLVSGVIGLMLAVVGGRIGLAAGRPLMRTVLQMYVRSDE